MSVLSHLNFVARNAVIDPYEKESIKRSIATIQTRLNYYFPDQLENHFIFGSYTRGTILPRFMDSESDIDYMIVFSDTDKTGATYITRLFNFANYYYTRSDIYRSSPTVGLDLNHIRFDLVPAINTFFGLQIPDKNGAWQSTTPNDFNKSLESTNSTNRSLIKPTIRLVKYWNALNGYVYESFALEKMIVSMLFFGCANQKDYFFTAMDNLELGLFAPRWKQDRLYRAKQIIRNVKSYEYRQSYDLAELELKKLIPYSSA